MQEENIVSKMAENNLDSSKQELHQMGDQLNGKTEMVALKGSHS